MQRSKRKGNEVRSTAIPRKRVRKSIVNFRFSDSVFVLNTQLDSKFFDGPVMLRAGILWITTSLPLLIYNVSTVEIDWDLNGPCQIYIHVSSFRRFNTLASSLETRKDPGPNDGVCGELLVSSQSLHKLRRSVY